MAKRKFDNAPQPESGRQPVKKSYEALIPVAILVGIVALVIIAGMNLYETRRQRTELNERIAQLVTTAGTKPTPAPPRQTGPDPEKVYTVKTDGAPFKGPSGAPITIAEFSEFQ
jgi:hypothetical protein